MTSSRSSDLAHEGEQHPGAEQIASLLDREIDVPGEPQIRAHLLSCRRCFGLYAEMAQSELGSRWQESAPPVPAEWLADAKALEGPVRRPEFAPATPVPTPVPIAARRTQRFTRRMAAAAAGLAMAVFAGVWWLQAGRDARLIAPVRVAVADASRTGLILGEPIASPGPVFRASGVSNPLELSPALDQLAKRYARGTNSEERAYWLAAGMLAEGDPGALGILSEAIERFPDSARLANLSAVLDYRERRVDKADRTLAGILERWPGDRVALFNRAFLLDQQGRSAEMTSVRDRLMNEVQPGTALEARAKAELFDPPSR